ncbi:MAG: S-layer homology domain-containing protein [Ruminiclostridium sp.]|nr:S-layer homology domain-containing protein [Ruminiclostridium sp.]
MKRAITLLLSLVMLLQLMVVGASAAKDPMTEILGTYEGYYYAHQGQTGVTLTVYREGDGVKAIFEFYNLPNHTNAKEGSFYMDVTWSNGSYYFDAGEWIEKPSTYITLDIQNAKLDDYILTGTMSTSGANAFYAEKPNDAYEDVQGSLFNDHRYELVDQGMTWQEAKVYAESKGGYLAVITSPEEQSFVESLVVNGTKKQYWLGGYRSGSSFLWVNGEAFSYSNWDSIEPNDFQGNESYVQIYRLKNPAVSGSRALKWNDINNENTIRGEENFFTLSNVGMVIEYDPIANSSDWADLELQEAYENDLIPDVLMGKDMTGRITRGEFAAVAVKLYEALSGNRMIIAMDAPFTDISNSAERLYILKAYNYSIVNGITPTEYKPDSLLTREQMATMLTRVYKKFEWPNYTINTDSQYTLDYWTPRKFADDALISDYAYQSVYFMVKHGIINGVENNCFAPNNSTPAQQATQYANATRQQALLISTRTLNNLGY